MSGSPITALWILFIGTAVLLILTWAIISITIVSRRRQLEVQEEKIAVIKNSEERYRRFFEEDLTGDFIAGADGKIRYCNSAFAKIFGYDSPDSVPGTNFSAHFTIPEDYDTFINELVVEQRLSYLETDLKKVDGQLLHAIGNIVAEHDENGELKQYHGYIFDNTERKSLEQQLIQAQKLQSISTLAGGIAHDFNNILSIILGHTSIISDSISGQRHKLSTSIHAIEKGVQRGSELADRILTFARKADIVFQVVNLNKIIEEAVGLLRETIHKTIKISLSLNTDLQLIRADATQCHQAVLNLCLNACDAMPTGGELSISTNMVYGNKIRSLHGSADENSYVELRVRDTGHGMTQEVKDRLFEPFFTTRPLGQGTGLGMSVVYGIAHSHSGHIHVESEENVGSEFFLYFPIVTDAIEDIPEKPIIRTALGSETILLVEDETSLVHLLQKIFTSSGYEVILALDGEDAVKKYREHYHEIDLVFTDSGLPKLDGWRAFQQMRQINPEVKAIFASGFFDPDLKHTMEENGIVDFIQKPYIPAEVVSHVREALDRPTANTHA